MLKLEHRQELVDGKFETIYYEIIRRTTALTAGTGDNLLHEERLIITSTELSELKKLLNNMTEI